MLSDSMKEIGKGLYVTELSAIDMLGREDSSSKKPTDKKAKSNSVDEEEISSNEKKPN